MSKKRETVQQRVRWGDKFGTVYPHEGRFHSIKVLFDGETKFQYFLSSENLKFLPTDEPPFPKPKRKKEKP